MKELVIINTRGAEGTQEVEADKLIKLSQPYVLTNDPHVAVRNGGNFNGTAFFLSSDNDWVLGKDNEGSTILVPLKKTF